jgi:hypothetical protein
MATDDLHAVQRDLDAMRAALDLDGATVDSARGHALIALAGLVTLLWVAVVPAPLQLWGLLSVLIPSGYLVAIRARHREAAGGSPAVRREFRDALRVLFLSVPIVAYTFWAQWLGVPPLVVLATAIFFIGVMMFGGSRHQPAMACWGVTLMAGALILPAKFASPVVVIAGVLILAGTLSALVARFDRAR